MSEYRPPDPSVTHSFKSQPWTPIKSGKYFFFPHDNHLYALERTRQTSIQVQPTRDDKPSE